MKKLVVFAVFVLATSSSFAQSNEIKQNNEQWQFNNGMQPLFILDDKIIKKDDLNSPNLDPTKIASIQVIRDKDAIEKYGEQGKNGVVIITSKERENQILNTPIEPLYVLDGKVIIQADFKINGLEPNDIESIQVLKGQNAIDQY